MLSSQLEVNVISTQTSQVFQDSCTTILLLGEGGAIHGF